MENIELTLLIALFLNYLSHAQDIQAIPTVRRGILSDCYAISGILCQENEIQAMAEAVNYDISQLRDKLKSILVADGYNTGDLSSKVIITLGMIRLNMTRLGEVGWVQTLEHFSSEVLESLIMYFEGKAVGDPSIREITWEAKTVATALAEDITKILQIIPAL